MLPKGTKPEPTYITVDPETAKRWLAANTVNRTIRSTRVNQYARDMAAGRWRLSNDAIAFSPDGKLLNGQHRLNAVVESGKAITFLVVRNLPIETMTTMDSGSARTAADALHFGGEQSTHMLAAVTKLCLLCTDGRIYADNHKQTVSHGEIIDFLNAHPDIRTSVKEISSLRRSLDAPPSPTAAAHWIISQVNEVTFATYYFYQVASRANEPERSAVLAVDSRLRDLRRNGIRLSARNYIYLLIKGWNYYARDERVSNLTARPKPGMEFRIPDPAKWSRP